jgi:ribosome-binding protein aMBF1 (putative translation factor)
MDHQDWNNITFNNKSNKEKKEELKKINSNKTSNPEKVSFEAPKELGKMISQARTSKQKNQKQFATELGISAQLLARWENNKESPTNPQIANIEKKLGVKLPRCKRVINDE